MVKMVLFDREDTLIVMPKKIKYLYGNDTIIFSPGVVEALKYLNSKNIIISIVTNQRGISLEDYPNMTIKSVTLFHNRLISLL